MGHLICGHMEALGPALTPRPQSLVGTCKVNTTVAWQVLQPWEQHRATRRGRCSPSNADGVPAPRATGTAQAGTNAIAMVHVKNTKET